MSDTGDPKPMQENRRVVPPGDVIFLEGQPGDGAYVILKGEVQIAVAEPGEAPVIINRLQAGQMFGEIALIQEVRRTATAFSQDGCELVVIDKAVFTKRLAEADPFLRFVVDHLCRLVLRGTERARQAE